MTNDLSLPDVELDRAEEKLQQRIESLESLLVAYSGGVDSAYLAWIARRALGHRMLAVIADSPSLPRREWKAAIRFAELCDIPLRVVATSEMERAEYRRNDSYRCFHCKDELFTLLQEQLRRTGFQHIAYGRNLDDDADFRPGQAAAAQHGIVAPLADAGLRKRDVRELARRAGLALWDKPASACLASRIEPGRPVTAEALMQVETGEEALHGLGFRQVRVRHHGEIARIEVALDEFERAFTSEMARAVVPIFKSIGFRYVTFDCEGYRSGSMNVHRPLSQIQLVSGAPSRRSE
jgi:uncharacterized protein